MVRLLDLPNELLLIVAEYLPIGDHVNFETCCHEVRKCLMADRWRYVHFSLEPLITQQKRCIHRIDPYFPQSRFHSNQKKYTHAIESDCGAIAEYIRSNDYVQRSVKGVCISGGSPQQVKKLLGLLATIDFSLQVIDLSNVAMDPTTLDTLKRLFPQTNVLLEVAHVSHNELIQDVPVKHPKIYSLSISFDHSTRHLFHSLGREPFMSYVRELSLFDDEPFQIRPLKEFLKTCRYLETLTINSLGENPNAAHWLPDTVKELYILEPYEGNGGNTRSHNGKKVRHLAIWGSMKSCLNQFQFDSLTHLTIMFIPCSVSDIALVLSKLPKLKWLKIVDLEYSPNTASQTSDVLTQIGGHTDELETLIVSTETILNDYNTAKMAMSKLKILIFDGSLTIPTRNSLYLLSLACPNLPCIYVANLSTELSPFPSYIKLLTPTRMKTKENKLLAAYDINCIIDLTVLRNTAGASSDGE